MTRAAGAAAALLLLILAAMALKGALIGVPGVPAQTEAGAFDTQRAMARLGRVLGPERPHPVDSAEGDAVRERLAAELRTLGLAPVVTDGMTCNGDPDDRTISCARIRNLTATMGPGEGRHLMMVSHYDSTPAGPGAADDGIGMAAMLETAANLRGRRLSRPVTFLFNEGEEAGLIGARAFLERDPLAARVDALVNLESRGVSGPAIMFETSRPNASALARFDRAVADPVANSLTTDFYRMVPNRSDVTVFKERDWTILNIAVIGNETRYHSPGDRLDALDPRSVGHMGAQALALAQDFTGREPVRRSGELVYADLLGRTLVAFPAWVGIALLWALLAAFALLAWRRRGGVARSEGAILLALADAAATVWILHAVTGWARGGGEWWRAHPDWISAGIDGVALASAAVALIWLVRPVETERLRTAFWLLFLLLGALVSLIAPGASIYFLAPPLIAGAGLLFPRWGKALALLAWAALFLTWAPLLHLSQVLLDFDSGWIYAPISALLLLPALIELKPLLGRIDRARLSAALAAVAVLAWLPAAFAPAYSADRKQRMTIEYVWDAAERKARWLVYHDRGPLPAAIMAAGPFERGVEMPWASWKRWSAPARGPAVEPPTAERIAERRTADGRVVTLRLRSRGADVIRLRAPPEAQWRAVRVAGGDVQRFGRGKEDEDYVFRCHGRSCDGLVLELHAGSPAPVATTTIGMRPGLPAEARPLVEARPTHAQPQYSPDATYAIGRTPI
ncbi:MAG TPA: M20/M25/M40 family metallo-hydrolase [Allosphingosinicella sp.]|nr:M20/M25/M40 family metallo-hydrolase [Allosphingosinicella sp.]